MRQALNDRTQRTSFFPFAIGARSAKEQLRCAATVRMVARGWATHGRRRAVSDARDGAASRIAPS